MAKANKINYANEVELKSLLIRNKNLVLGIGDTSCNERIRELVDCYIKTDTLRQSQRMVEFRKRLKEHIVWMSEKTCASEDELDRLGSIVRLMISRILNRPQYSGYTYTDEFYSDAQFKIFRYMTNFDHRKISKTSGETVNAFAYITQIIQNSIIHVISINKKQCDKVKQEYRMQQLKFAADNPAIKVQLDMVSEDRSYPESKIAVSKYYYDKETFSADLRRYLENLDFNKVETLTVYHPKGCSLDEFSGYNIKFVEHDC